MKSKAIAETIDMMHGDYPCWDDHPQHVCAHCGGCRVCSSACACDDVPPDECGCGGCDPHLTADDVAALLAPWGEVRYEDDDECHGHIVVDPDDDESADDQLAALREYLPDGWHARWTGDGGTRGDGSHIAYFRVVRIP